MALVGGVQAHKGALVFEEVVRRLEGEDSALDRLRRRRCGAAGPAAPAAAGAGPRLLPERHPPALLRRDGVDLALLLSIVPESYSLVLDECAAAGVPVVAFDLGAVRGAAAWPAGWCPWSRERKGLSPLSRRC